MFIYVAKHCAWIEGSILIVVDEWQLIFVRNIGVQRKFIHKTNKLDNYATL